MFFCVFSDCFLAYDVHGRGHLEKDDIHFWLKRSYYNLNPMTETQKMEFFGDIYQLIVDRFLNGRDDFISFRQYRTAVCDHPALMQIIGTVLPDNTVTMWSFFRRRRCLMLRWNKRCEMWIDLFLCRRSGEWTMFCSRAFIARSVFSSFLVATCPKTAILNLTPVDWWNVTRTRPSVTRQISFAARTGNQCPKIPHHQLKRHWSQQKREQSLMTRQRRTERTALKNNTF